jgi:hypothetical protein
MGSNEPGKTARLIILTELALHGKDKNNLPDGIWGLMIYQKAKKISRDDSETQ